MSSGKAAKTGASCRCVLRQRSVGSIVFWLRALMTCAVQRSSFFGVPEVTQVLVGVPRADSWLRALGDVSFKLHVAASLRVGRE
eukprot:6297654-Prymnesium_polylepis.1